MVERSTDARSRPKGTRARAPYALPDYAARPRQRLSIGVTGVLITGLMAVGLAGFVSVSAMFDPPAHATPVGDGAEPDSGPTQEPPPEQTGADVLTKSPLYSTGEMTDVTCKAPDLDPDDEASMENFLHDMTDCLDDAWSEQFADTVVEFEPPSRIYWYAAGQSPCGNYPALGTAAFYCQANEGLYLGVDDIVANSNESEHPEAYTFLLSHEYAHHVQGEAGILGRFHNERGAAADGTIRDLLTRRSELQANCLGGAFLGAVGTSFPIGAQEYANILEDAERRSDYGSGDRTHGSPSNGRMWTAHGMDRVDPAACNTWEAREDVVE